MSSHTERERLSPCPDGTSEPQGRPRPYSTSRTGACAEAVLKPARACPRAAHGCSDRRTRSWPPVLRARGVYRLNREPSAGPRTEAGRSPGASAVMCPRLLKLPYDADLEERETRGGQKAKRPRSYSWGRKADAEPSATPASVDRWHDALGVRPARLACHNPSAGPIIGAKWGGGQSARCPGASPRRRPSGRCPCRMSIVRRRHRGDDLGRGCGR
jgi:hypothetical protein